MSASRMATRLTSGRSRPSRSRLMPTTTSMEPRRRSLMISIRSKVSTSWCIYLTLTPCSVKKSVRSSAIFLVRVVTRTRSFFAVRALISPSRSVTWPSTGRTEMSGSSRPVGRMTCCAICVLFFRSYSPGVADTNTIWFSFDSTSSNLSGRLSNAEGRRKPYSTSVFLRAKSPPYIARTWGRVTWLSSTKSRKSSGK